MILRGEATEKIRYSQIFPIKYRDKIYFIGCHHGLGIQNYIYINNGWQKCETFGCKRYDVAIHTIDNYTGEFYDYIANTDNIKKLKMESDILKIYSENISIEKKSFNIMNSVIVNTCSFDIDSPKIPHIVSSSVPKKIDLASLSGSPILKDDKVIGFLSKIVNKQNMYFIHISIAMRIIAEIYKTGKFTDVQIVPLEKKLISFNNDNDNDNDNNNSFGFLIVSDFKDYPLIKNDIIVEFDGISVDSDSDIDRYTVINTLPKEKLKIKYFRSVSDDDYEDFECYVDLFSLSEVEVVPLNSNIFKYSDHTFTELNSKLFYDLSTVHQTLDDNICGLKKLSFTDNKKRYICVLSGKKIYPIAKKGVLTIPIITSVNNCVPMNLDNFKDIISSKKKIHIEYMLGNIKKKIVI